MIAPDFRRVAMKQHASGRESLRWEFAILVGALILAILLLSG